MNLKISSIYLFSTGTILLGFLMLVQPVSMQLFSWGLPVLIVGGVIHIVLDHLPTGLIKRFDERNMDWRKTDGRKKNT